MTRSTPIALLLGAVVAFVGWIAYDSAHPPKKDEPCPTIGPARAVCVPVQISESAPFLEPGMPREVVESIVAQTALEESEELVVVRGAPTRRVTYTLAHPAVNHLPVVERKPGEWTQLVVDFDATNPAQLVSRISLDPIHDEGDSLYD